MSAAHAATATALSLPRPLRRDPDPAAPPADQAEYAIAACRRLIVRLSLLRLRADSGQALAASQRACESVIDAELLPALEDLGLGMGGIYGARLAALEEAAEIAAEAEKIADAQRELRAINQG